MSLAGLDWSVIKNQNYARNPQGHVVPVSSYSIFRDTDGAELVSNVGEGFTVKQNRECFQFVDDLLQDNGGAHYDSAAALERWGTVQRSGAQSESHVPILPSTVKTAPNPTWSSPLPTMEAWLTLRPCPASASFAVAVPSPGSEAEEEHWQRELGHFML